MSSRSASPSKAGGEGEGEEEDEEIEELSEHGVFRHVILFQGKTSDEV